MKQWIYVLAIFFLGFGTGQFFNVISLQKQKSTTPPTVETKIATVSSEITVHNTNEGIRVTRVVDGDTIEIADGRRVRYIGIDTPESVDPRRPVECFGKEAKDENIRLVLGKSVVLQKDISDTDRYGRLLRYVYVDGVMMNDVLVRQGYANAVSYPPDVRYQEQLMQAEQEAREHKRGLWAGCTVMNSTNLNTSPPQENSSAVLSESSDTCTIKGNISSSGEKIYHVPGCDAYEKTSINPDRGEEWLCTEEEAVNKGYRKAKNC